MKYITRKKKSNKFIYVDEKNVEIKNKEVLNKISKIYTKVCLWQKKSQQII